MPRILTPNGWKNLTEEKSYDGEITGFNLDEMFRKTMKSKIMHNDVSPDKNRHK